MTSRLSAARPKRAGEFFARTHHGGNSGEGPSSSKKIRFDLRNPSALAPDTRDQDDEDGASLLEADVIGMGAGATKRGAVNIDGYDSDSDSETYKDRAEARMSRAHGDMHVDFADQLENYNEHLRNSGDVAESRGDDDEDIFAAEREDEDEDDGNKPYVTLKSTPCGAKEVRFLDTDNILGQEHASRSGGTVRLDDRHPSSDDDDELELAIQEEGVDEEVGMGGSKRNAPKIDAFNMKAEQEDGAFDESGNFIRKAADPDSVHDRWLEGVSKKEVKKAAEAHEKRQAEVRQQRMEDDSMLTEDLLESLILNLKRGETPIEALARLGKGKKKEKQVPKWKLKKLKKKTVDEGQAMDVDAAKEAEDLKQVNIKGAINAITDAADKLLGRDHAEIYETERELLIRDWQTEAGERWKEPDAQPQDTGGASRSGDSKKWEYRWTDGRDGGIIQGPYDGPAMKAWQDAGYFDEVEFRCVGEEEWSRLVEFA